MNIRNLLAKKYGGDDWIFLEEVRERPGFRAERSADAVAMGLWESRGLEIIAFEIKEHRSDWLRELKRPEKAAPIFALVDRFYLVSSEKVAQKEEIPSAWGWMERQGSRLIERRRAPLISKKPTMIDRGFAAMLLKRAKAGMPTDEKRIQELADERSKKQIEDQKEAFKVVENGLIKKAKSLEREIEDWTRLSGFRYYPGKDVSETFKVLRELLHGDFDESELVRVAHGMQNISKSLLDLRPLVVKARQSFRKEIEHAQHTNSPEAGVGAADSGRGGGDVPSGPDN